MRRRHLLAAIGLLAGCGARPGRETGDGDSATDGTGDTGPTTDGAGDPTVDSLPGDASYGFTYLRADGNRYATGRGAVPAADPVDVPLPAPPEWVVAAPVGGETVWGLLLADGRVRAYRLAGGSVSRIDEVTVTGKGPPMLAVSSGAVRLLNGGFRYTHPTPVPGGGASIGRDGNLVLPGGTLDVRAIPDARIVVADGTVFLLADPTDTYDHAVLGDDVEAGAVAAVDPGSRTVHYLRPGSGVLEGTAPIVTDVDGDGDREVLATASDAERGARLVAFRPDGGVAAAGPPVGTGYRWRHQIAVAPFAPDGTREVAAVRSPHLGGVAEFYRADGDRLRIVATRSGGYASHRAGSRNLDMAAAGDFDGDGRPELLVPGADGRRLVALRRTADGVEEAWTEPLGSRLLSNLAAASGDGGTVLGAGFGRTLRLWPASASTG